MRQEIFFQALKSKTTIKNVFVHFFLTPKQVVITPKFSLRESRLSTFIFQTVFITGSTTQIVKLHCVNCKVFETKTSITWCVLGRISQVAKTVELELGKNSLVLPLMLRFCFSVIYRNFFNSIQVWKPQKMQVSKLCLKSNFRYFWPVLNLENFLPLPAGLPFFLEHWGE